MSLSLDRPTAARLADLDPALAPLARALPARATGPGWQLHDARWTPGAGCRLAYRVATPAGTTFVAVDVDGGGWSQRDYRADAGLPGLAPAADPLAVAEVLSPLCGGPIRRLHIEPVRYRPGSRCVLRYQVSTAAQVTTLYAKALSKEAYDGVAAVGARLEATRERAPLVPRLAGTWPERQVVIAGGVRGRSMSSILGDPAVSTRRRIGLARELGHVLARFHEQAAADVPTRSAADHVAALAGSMVAVRCADARLAARLCAAVELLAAGAPAPGAAVLCHGAFRAG